MFKNIPLVLIGTIVFYPISSLSAIPFRVVIDPGHGGVDEGTIYLQGKQKITEKEITLQLARQVAYRLRAQGMQVTLTRNSDRDLSLPARTALANRLGANVFVSIHMNSARNSPVRDAEGIETYILNNATDASSRRLAHLENSVISKIPSQSPQQTDIALILKDLRLDGNLAESKRLACNVQTQLVGATSRATSATHRDRGVKQALFHVLLGADMPSILVEVGFLSNLQDRKWILSPQGRRSISRALAEAIAQYRTPKNKISASLRMNRCKIN